jgi:hypothetical protein
MKRLIGAAALATLALSGAAVEAASEDPGTNPGIEVHRADPMTGITAAFVGMDAKDHAGYGPVDPATPPYVYSGGSGDAEELELCLDPERAYAVVICAVS